VIVTVEPVILSFGPLAVRWFGLLALVGLALASWLSLRAVQRQGLPLGAAGAALAWALPAGILSGRLVHVLGWWDYYVTHAAELGQLSVDGLSVWGGLLGGGLVATARLRARGDPHLPRHAADRARRVLDAVVPSVALGLAIGQVGAFLDGHGQGLPSNLPWATQYSSRLAATPDFGVPRHPAQLYEALILLALSVGLARLPRGWPAGTRVATFVVVYGLARLGLGTVRLEPAFLFGWQIEQLLAVAAICGVLTKGAGLWLAARRAGATQRQPTTATGPPAASGEETMAA
jgi:phosphatidylglycerol:prolipoprotein diacylglycerol transferase